MTRYDATTFLADGKHMIDNLAVVMAVLMISAVVVALGGVSEVRSVDMACGRVGDR